MGGTAALAATIAAPKAKEVYDYNKERRRAKQNLVGLKTQKNMELKKAENLLERNLAERKARISSMGLNDSASALAAKKRLKVEGLTDMARTNYDYRLKERSLKNDFRDKRDEFVYNSLLQPKDESKNNRSVFSLLAEK